MRVAVFNDTREAGHYGCEGVMQRLEAGLAARGLRPVFRWPSGQDWRAARHRLPRPGDIDLMVVNGEGSIHHSADRPRAMYLAALSELARSHYGVPCFLVNATLHCNEAEAYRLIAGFDAVFVRDTGSLGELRRHGIDGRVVPDLTVARARGEGGRHAGPRRGMGVTDSVLPYGAARLRQLARANAGEFVPMVVPAWPSLRGARHPIPYLRRLKARMALHPAVRRRPADLAAFLRWLEAKEVVVTGRFHTVTLCLRTGTPFVAVDSNTPKIRWLVQDVFGDSARVVADVEDLDAGLVRACAAYSPAETRRLDAFRRSAEARIEAMFDGIAETARSARRARAPRSAG
ncbi:MAG: polysaccharide pyruvyl transferase family protein [Alkalilacustris sp.]